MAEASGRGRRGGGQDRGGDARGRIGVEGGGEGGNVVVLGGMIKDVGGQEKRRGSGGLDGTRAVMVDYVERVRRIDMQPVYFCLDQYRAGMPDSNIGQLPHRI